MSQKKVDQYKESKKNRKKIMKKEKIVQRVEITLCVLALAALVGWFSVAVYHNVKSNEASNATASTTSLDLSAVDDYMSGISSSSSSSTSSDTVSSGSSSTSASSAGTSAASTSATSAASTSAQ